MALFILFAAGMIAPSASAVSGSTDAHEPADEGGLLATLGRLHPAAVHFPIALVIAAGLAELLAVRRVPGPYDFVARFLLYTAAVISIPAAALGFAAASGEVFQGDAAFHFSIHRIAGIAAPVLVVLTAGVAASAHRTGQPAQRALYRVLLVLSVLCVMVAGYFGGELVFGS